MEKMPTHPQDAKDEHSLLSGDDCSGVLKIVTSDEEEAPNDNIPTDAEMVAKS